MKCDDCKMENEKLYVYEDEYVCFSCIANEYPRPDCDICGEEKDLYIYDDKIMCSGCFENALDEKLKFCLEGNLDTYF